METGSPIFPAAEYWARISRLQGALAGSGLDGAVLTFPTDVYYFTGTRQNSTLWVPAAGKPALLVKKSLSRAKQDCPFLEAAQIRSLKHLAGIVPQTCRKIGAAFDVTTMAQRRDCLKALPGLEFSDIAALIKQIRSVKSQGELRLMRESAARLAEAFRQAPRFLKPGMSELDASAEMEYLLRKAGGEGYVKVRAMRHEYFMGIVATAATAGCPGFFDGAVTGAGPSSAVPHGASRALIGKNSPVFIDFAVSFNGYAADMTRIFVFGKLTGELERAFETSLDIQNHTAGNLTRNTLEELYLKALDTAQKAGLAEYFMGPPQERAKFIGHGLGLEIDEPPVIAKGFREPAKPGQVIAIEPKFVFPGLGAVGIENTFETTEGGARKLTDLDDGIVYL